MRDENDIPSGDVFTALVASRVKQHQRKRKTVFILGILLAAIVCLAGFLLLPGQIFDIDTVGMADIFTVLLLIVLCAVMAMATEQP